MLIRSVHLENIKSYVDETIELRPGLVAVSGRNGAGKSTILEVVGFALFGFLAGTQASLLREGAGSGGFEVVFQSRVDGRDYATPSRPRRLRFATPSAAAPLPKKPKRPSVSCASTWDWRAPTSISNRCSPTSSASPRAA